MKRAERRYKKYLKILKARKVRPWYDRPEKIADHLANCSCYMCGNPRKYFNEKTFQEKKFYSEEIDKDD